MGARARSEEGEAARRRRNRRRRLARRLKKRLRETLRAAYHESGHAVIAFVLRIAGLTERVTVVPDREDAKPWGAAGLHYRAQRIPPVVGRHVDQAAVAAEMVVLFAGVEGEEFYTGRKRNGGWGDLEIARQLDVEARRADLRDLVRESERRAPMTDACLARMVEDVTAQRERAFRAYRAKARRLVRAHWPEIQAVARALVQRGELSGDEVREVIEACRARPERAELMGGELLAMGNAA